MFAIKHGVWIGAAFAFGLCFGCAGVASADAPDLGTAAASSGTGKQSKAATRPARVARSEVAANAVTGRQAAVRAENRAGGMLSARRNIAATPKPTAAPPTPPSVTLHNNTGQTLRVYNLPASGNYSVPTGFAPVEVANGNSTPVVLAAGTGPAGSPKNRIYLAEGPTGFALPVTSTSGVDAFNPTVPTAGNSFVNYSFIEYYLYSASDGSQYTVDTSYIDEWSLPIQMQFTLNGADWKGAVDGRRYGFNDFDTVVSQLKAAGGPYGDLVWSGGTPWVPQPPATVSRIIGPDKVWAQQSSEPAANVNMNQSGWVPTSYQNFVQYGSYSSRGRTVYPYAQDGKQYSARGNFNFWKDEVTAPASTPYPMALRTAAVLDKFPADQNGVYGFFTYPNDEAAGQFTNIPTTVSLDLYVFGSSDGSSHSVIEGGDWIYSAPCASLSGTAATDTYILDRVYRWKLRAPEVRADSADGDLVMIDNGALAGSSSTQIDFVDEARFWGRGRDASQFVYESSTGRVYYDRFTAWPGYTGVLANLSPNSNPVNALFVL